VHGEDEAREGLRVRLGTQYGCDVRVPKAGEQFEVGV
jgi:hypothetical protein